MLSNGTDTTHCLKNTIESEFVTYDSIKEVIEYADKIKIKYYSAELKRLEKSIIMIELNFVKMKIKDFLNFISGVSEDAEIFAKDNKIVINEHEQNITDKIKTFADAVKWCEDNNHGELVRELDHNLYDCAMSDDVIAYLQLRIITTALNEGWKPIVGEDIYAPAFHNIDDIGDIGDLHSVRSTPFMNNNDYYGDSAFKLVFKSEELADYAACQFTDIYADFCGCKKGDKK